MVFGLSATDDRTVAAELGVSPFFVKDYMQAVKSYGQQNIEKILLLLHTYNLKSIGIGDNGTSDADLVKELIIKMTFD